MYVITRTDLSPEQQAVQAAHAAIEVARTSISPSLEHPHLVICGVKSEAQLVFTLDKIRAQGVRCFEWHEADLDNQLTSISTEPVFGDNRRIFRRFKLLNFQSEVSI